MPAVLNPGFDVDLSSWSKTDADASTTWTRDTITVHSGAGSSKLVNTAAGQDDFLVQAIGGLIAGATYTVAAWLNVTAFTAAAIGNRGLHLVSQPTNIEADSAITAVTAGWELRTVTITIGGADSGIDIRLYAPQATLFWDDIAFVSAPAPSRRDGALGALLQL